MEKILHQFVVKFNKEKMVHFLSVIVLVENNCIVILTMEVKMPNVLWFQTKCFVATLTTKQNSTVCEW